MKKHIILFLALLTSGIISAATGPILICMTQSGGTQNAGTVMQYIGGDTTVHVLVNLDSMHYDTHFISGYTSPYATVLTTGPNHKIYGTQGLGGTYGAGAVFEYDYATNNFQNKVLVDSVPNNWIITGGLVLANNGLMYGISNNAISDEGNMFSYNPGDTVITNLAPVATDGSVGNFAPLIQASDSNLYGILWAGGSAGTGSIFQYNIQAGTDTQLYSLPAVSGSITLGGLLEVGADTLYGLTNGDGTNGGGTIFRYDIVSGTYTVLYNLATHAWPNGSLMRASDGKLYATTAGDGAHSSGTIFSYDISTGTYTDLYDFPPYLDGGTGALYQASDGMLYGFTVDAGLNYGTGGAYYQELFQFNINTSTYTTEVLLDSATGYAIAGMIEYIPAAPVVTGQPSGDTACPGSSVSFSIADSGVVIAIQWQVSTDSGTTYTDISGATDTVYTFTAAYSQNGYYYRSIVSNSVGADTSKAVSLTVFSPAVDTVTTFICAGDSFVVGTSAFYAAGTYSDTLHGISVHGCDSIVTLNLSIYAPATDSITATICLGDSFLIGTTAYHTAGSFTDTLHGASANGCDSIVTLHLSIYAPASSSLAATICTGDSFSLNGTTYYTAGTYTNILINASVHGCDSLVILTLGTYAPALDTIRASICPGDSFTFGTQVLYTAGTYYDTLSGASVNGCDSLLTLVLSTGTLTPGVTISTGHSHTICTGTVITFTAHPTNGGTSPTYEWYVSGVATDTGVTFVDSTLRNADSVWVVMVSNAPCASVDTVYSNIIPYVVDSFLTPGVSFVSTNTGDTICDNTVVNLLATAVNGGNNPDFQWQVNGVNAGNSSTYIANPVVNGEVITCILTSNASCLTHAKDTSAPMTFTVIPYPAISVSQSGGGAVCPGDTVVLTASGGSSYIWSTGATTQSILSTGGTYRVTATSAYGCTAGSTPVTVQVITAGTDSLTQMGDSLISGTSQFYQWYFDDSIITGAIGPVYVPAHSGYYQVAVIDSFGCIEYSQPIYILEAGINALSADPSVSIYPNPNTGKFTLTLSDQAPQSVTITDALGRVVVSGQRVAGQQQFDLHAEADGVYYMLITDGHTTRSVRFDIVR